MIPDPRQLLCLISPCLLLVVSLARAHAQPIYVAVHGGSSPGIWRLEDTDGDERALGAGEVRQYATNGPTGFVDVATSSSGIHCALAADTSAVFRVADANNDGDALDAGEVSVFRDQSGLGLGVGGPLSIAVAEHFDPKLVKNRTWVYVTDLEHLVTVRLEDVDGDGDAQGSGEMSIVQRSSNHAPFAPSRMTVDEFGRIVACNSNNNTVVRVTDINGDGFANVPDPDPACPASTCGMSVAQEFHVIGEHVNGQSNLFDPFGVTLLSDGDYLVSDVFHNEPQVTRLSDFNGDDDALDAGEVATYYFFGEGIGALDLVAGDDDVVYVSEDLAGGAVVKRLDDRNGDGDAMDAGEASIYATFRTGTPFGLSIRKRLPPAMLLRPQLTDFSPMKGPLLVVEDGVTVKLAIQVVDRAAGVPARGVRLASYVLAGCFALCPLTDRTDGEGMMVYEVTRTAASPSGGEALKFWVYGHSVVVPVVSTPCDPDPVADPGSDQEVPASQAVTLDGSASVGKGLLYCWEQTGGPDVGLPKCSETNPLVGAVTFNAPPTPTTLTFQLTVRNACDKISAPATVSVAVTEAAFLRGDCNGDGAVDISDASAALTALFLGGSAVACEDACDSNDYGVFDISDAVNVLVLLFLGQGNIPPPGTGTCGIDPTDDSIGCGSFSNCP